MLEEHLEGHSRKSLFILGCAVGGIVGICAGVFASIVHPATPVYLAILWTAIIVCLLFSLARYTGLSIGLGIGLGGGLSLGELIASPLSFSPDIGISIAGSGLFLALFGWMIRYLLQRNTEKSA